MTNIVTLVPRPEDRLIVDTTAALLRFASLRLQAFHLLTTAANLPCLPDKQQAQATAAAKLCGLRLHRSVGEVTPNDVDLYRADLEAVAKIVDHLVQALGESAIVDLGVCRDEEKLFRDQLSDALEGNALYVIEQRAEELRADLNEQRSTSRRAPRDWE